MGIFTPPDSCNVGATRVWLVAAMVALALAGIALLAQAAQLSRRAARLRVAWWGRLPLALPAGWAGVCAVVAAWAFISYRDARGLPPCPPGRTWCMYNPLCLPTPPLGGEAQHVLAVAACTLILGWLALATFARRIAGGTS